MSLPVVILGAGGHGRVVADVCRSVGCEVAGFLDSAHPVGSSVDGGRILGADDRLEDASFVSEHVYAIGLGDPALRCLVADRVLAAGGVLPVFAHTSSVVAPDVSIGPGSVLMAGAIVNPGSSIGDLVVINTGTTVDHDCVIGDGTHLCPGVHLAGNVTCGARAYVGIGASVVQGIRIGEAAVVGAGAVVIRDVAEGRTVVGCPAAPIRHSA